MIHDVEHAHVTNQPDEPALQDNFHFQQPKSNTRPPLPTHSSLTSNNHQNLHRLSLFLLLSFPTTKHHACLQQREPAAGQHLPADQQDIFPPPFLVDLEPRITGSQRQVRYTQQQQQQQTAFGSTDGITPPPAPPPLVCSSVPSRGCTAQHCTRVCGCWRSAFYFGV